MAALGLRARLVLFICVAVAPVLGLLIWLHADSRRQQAARIDERVTERAEQIADGTAVRSEAARQFLAVIVRDDALKTPESPACGRYLHELMQSRVGIYTGLAVATAEGVVVCSSDPDAGLQVADRDFVRRVVQAGAFTVGEVGPDGDTGRPLLNYGVPVLDGLTLRGVAVAALNVDELRHSLGRVPVRDGAGVAVLDRSGAVIASQPDHGWLDDRLDADTLRHVTDGSLTLLRRAGPDGVRRQYAMTWVDSRRDMLAVAGLREDDGLTAAGQTATTVLLVLIAAGVVGSAAAMALAEHQVQRPVARLLAGARRLGAGDLAARAPVTSGARELRELSAAFDRMAATLQVREHHARESQHLEAIGQLAGGLAHDFNNMLTVIMGFSHELRSEVRSPEGRQNLTEIVAAAERAGNLTRQLLTFAKRQVVLPRPMQLNHTVAQTGTMLRQAIGPDIRVASVLGHDLGIVRADSSQIEQVLVNLVLNARDAMPGGGVLTIETANLLIEPGGSASRKPAGNIPIPSGEYVQLSVSDTGQGMEPEVCARIFEPFFTTKGSRGTGLGLAIAYGIITQSGGFICCESTPGQGTRVSVLFPRVDDALPHDGPRASEGPARREAATILVVEDEPSLRMLTERVLRSAGYIVVTADAPDQALEQVRLGLRPQLLLTDLAMPHMNGVALAQSIRLMLPGVGIMYMSAHTDHAFASVARIDPAAFLGKPFTSEALLSAVRAVLDAPANV